MTKYCYSSSSRLPRSLLIVPRRKIRRLLLGTFVLSTISLFSVAMVMQIQDIENRGNVYSPEDTAVFDVHEVEARGDDLNQRLPLPGKEHHRNLVARETLAVGDDYQDLTVNNNNKNADQKVNGIGGGGETFQRGGLFLLKNDNNEKKAKNDESQWHASQLSKKGEAMELKRSNSSRKSLSHPSQPFQKTADANGRVMFEIKNFKGYREKRKPSVVKFNNNNQAEEETMPKLGRLHHNRVGEGEEGEKEENYYGYNNNNNYDEENSEEENGVVSNNNDKGEELKQIKQGAILGLLGAKKFKFLAHNSTSKNMQVVLAGGGGSNKDDDDENNIVQSDHVRKKISSRIIGNLLHDDAHKEPAESQAQGVEERGENWPNSHQMRGNNDNSKKSGQFVVVGSAGNSVKNINSINYKKNEEDAALAPAPHHNSNNNEGPNLLEGIMDNDHRRTRKTRPCVKKGGETCLEEEEADTDDANEEGIGPRTSKMDDDHYNPPNKLPESVRGEGDTVDREQLDSENPIKKASFNPAVVVKKFLNNHRNIETQIPIQDGGGDGGPGLVVPVQYPATQLQYPNSLRRERNITLQSQQGMPLIVDGIYWSKEAVALVPTGISEEEFQDFLKATSTEKVVVMEKASSRKCGRPKNQFIQLESGRKMCARYRDHFKMEQGEILSFYLSRFLGLDNIPPVALALVDSNASQWQDVKPLISDAGWSQNHVINQIMWIDFLGGQSHTKMPPLLLKAYEANKTLSWHDQSLGTLPSRGISELIQWSDMLLFDYITGNYDRIASMQDGAYLEKKPDIMHETMRNLPKDNTGKLWLIDNESGLLDAYNLVLNSRLKFHRFHKQMLETLCIFNRQTISKILTLATFPEPHELLVNYAEQQDPLYKLFPAEHNEFTLFRQLFHTRLKDIKAWTEHCKTL